MLEDAGPVMRTGARFHADKARRQLRHQRRQLAARNTRLDQHRLAGVVHAVNGEHILGKIDPDSDHSRGVPSTLVLMDVRNFIMTCRSCLTASAAASERGSRFIL